MTEVRAAESKKTPTDTRELFLYEATCPFCGHRNKLLISHAEGDEVCDDPVICQHYDAFGVSRQMYFIDKGQLWTTGRNGCVTCIRIWDNAAQGSYTGHAEKDQITETQALKALKTEFPYVIWRIKPDPHDNFAWLIKGQAPACEGCGEGYFDGRFGHCPVCGWDTDPA